ncbi:MAG: hypothetical protein IKT05_06610 [Fibrobacter sp.]|nr:hypothetical protein [Fibrobacter sp.]
MHAIEKLTRISIPEGDKAIYEKLPPQQKETPESEMRNARGRGFPRREQNRGQNHGKPNRDNRGNDNRGNNNREHNHAAKKPQNEKRPAPKSEGVQNVNQVNLQEGRRTIGKNRPGSRARKRMREAAEAARRAQAH